jgi:ketosteroid isomerase-like protein
MKFSHPLIIVTASLLASCLTSDRAAADGARQLIEAEIARGVEATKSEDIEAYMHGIPEDYVIYDESGEVITREQMRANALRDWSVISRTLDLTITVDSLLLPTDSTAVVYTSQRWERMMSRPDSSGEDTVLTTQRHRETWRRTPVGWRNYDIDELGGAIFINGAPYSPKRDAR